MTSFFQKNLQALLKKNPSVGALSTALPEGMEVFDSKTGPVTARFHDRLLHSAYDPVKEAAAFVRNIPKGSRIGLYGFGLGYHIEALLEKIGPAGKVIVIELNPDLLAAAFHSRDCTPFLTDERLELIFSDQEKTAAERITRAMPDLMQDESNTPRFLFHPASFECLPGKFPNIATALEIIRLERRVPAMFGDLEHANAIRNWDTILSTPGIAHLRDRYPGRPGVLVSAGPSLDGMRPFLPLLKKNCVVGCVDTAFPTLMAQGIAPHFIFSLDPQEESFSHFKNYLQNRSPIVFPPTANSRMVRHYAGDKYVVFKEGHAITLEHKALAQEKGLTQAGGSVSCLALDCLLQMGCDPVFLIGQDCAHAVNRSYARKEDFANPGVPDGRANSQKIIPVTGCQGIPLPTTHALYSYLRTLEQIIEAHPQKRIFNLSSQGALIAGADGVGSINELMTLIPDCVSLVE